MIVCKNGSVCEESVVLKDGCYVYIDKDGEHCEYPCNDEGCSLIFVEGLEYCTVFNCKNSHHPQSHKVAWVVGIISSLAFLMFCFVLYKWIKRRGNLKSHFL